TKWVQSWSQYEYLSYFLLSALALWRAAPHNTVLFHPAKPSRSSKICPHASRRYAICRLGRGGLITCCSALFSLNSQLHSGVIHLMERRGISPVYRKNRCPRLNRKSQRTGDPLWAENW